MPGEKTEKATSKRREDERKKGHAFQSHDIVTAVSLLCFFQILKVQGMNIQKQISVGMKKLFESLPVYISGPSDIKSRMIIVVSTAVQVLLPIIISVIIIAIVLTLAQTRLLVNFGQMKPDFKRMSIIQGFKRLFSLKSLMELIKSLAKVITVGVIVFLEIKPKINDVMRLYDTSLADSLKWVGQTLLDIGIKASIAMFIIGIVDYVYQWWSYERGIRMSKEDIKDENKQMEGNPETKGRIRNIQRKMSRMRMMQAVPDADVVIRNPTHYAIALKYDITKAKAPVVVAKGMNNVALKIVEIAEENGVHVTENRPLAQALYKTVEVGQEIPAEFYKAVAEVLAYIYKLKRAGRL